MEIMNTTNLAQEEERRMERFIAMVKGGEGKKKQGGS